LKNAILGFKNATVGLKNTGLLSAAFVITAIGAGRKAADGGVSGYRDQSELDE